MSLSYYLDKPEQNIWGGGAAKHGRIRIKKKLLLNNKATNGERT